jgi:hypothetical protein
MAERDHCNIWPQAPAIVAYIHRLTTVLIYDSMNDVYCQRRSRHLKKTCRYSACNFINVYILQYDLIISIYIYIYKSIPIWIVVYLDIYRGNLKYPQLEFNNSSIILYNLVGMVHHNEFSCKYHLSTSNVEMTGKSKMVAIYLRRKNNDAYLCVIIIAMRFLRPLPNFRVWQRGGKIVITFRS